MKEITGIRNKYFALMITFLLVFMLFSGIRTPQIHAAETNVALQATATASSVTTGSPASAINDGVVAGYPNSPGNEWASAHELVGAWAQLTWSSAQTINKISLFDRPNTSDQITSGTLTFSDGSSISVGALPNDASSPATVTFANKTVSWVKFTTNSVLSGTFAAGLAEFQVISGSGGTPTPTPTPTPSPVTNVALQATATASSVTTGSPASAINDGVVAGYPNSPGNEWASAHELVGAWAQLTWGSAQTINQISLFDRPNTSDQITSGTLTFSDGSSISVGALPNDASSPATVTFANKTVSWVKFTANSVLSGTFAAGLAEFQVFSGSGGTPTPTPTPTPSPVTNVALQATATVSSVTTGSPASAINDGVVAGYPNSPGNEWASAHELAGAWAQLTWGSAQTINQISLFDRPNTSDQITSGTLTFSDGSSISVGALPNDASSPATVTFANKTVSWVKFTANSVLSGTFAAGLAEFQVFSGSGGTPTPTPTPTPSATPTSTPTPTVTPTPTPGAYPQYQTSVVSPAYGATVSGTTTISFYAPGMKNVFAIVRHQPDATHTDPKGYDAWFQQIIPDVNGYGVITFPADDYPHGPMTMNIASWDSPPGDPNYTHSDNSYLQLYNNGGVLWNQGVPAAPPQAQGMSVVYQDDFNGPLSISRTGAGTTYTSLKPDWPNGSEFGDAIFADYEGPYNPFAIVGNNYLRIRASKTPPGYVDPMGWNRTFFSGNLSAVRIDGTGISATYGYFEARMLMPAGKGTWPAFWLMSQNSFGANRVFTAAEIDTVEGYGHDPSTSCQSLHSWGTSPELHTGVCPAFSDGSLATWHTYGTKITPTDIIYYIDNAEVWRKPTTNEAKTPMFFMFTLALGGGWPIDLARYNNQVDMYVDYVRMFQ